MLRGYAHVFTRSIFLSRTDIGLEGDVPRTVEKLTPTEFAHIDVIEQEQFTKRPMVQTISVFWHAIQEA